MARRPLVRTLAIFIALAASAGGAAVAAEPPRVWVEASAHQRRADAVADKRALDLDALSAAVSDDDLDLRIVRRFVPGSGWRHVLQLEGVDDLEDGRTLVAAVAAAGVTARLVGEIDGRVQVIDERAAKPAGAASGARTEPVPPPDPEAGLLRKAVKAHGGPRGGREILAAAPALAFAFERRMVTDAGVLLAANRFSRMGDALRLEVDIVEGEGSDSRTVLTPGNLARLRQGDDAEVLERDPARTREVLSRFSPEEVLAVPLGFARDVERGGPWEGLEAVDRVPCGDGRTCEVLRLPQSGADDDVATGDDPGGDRLVEAWLGRDDHLLRAIAWETAGGRLRFELADYRQVVEDLVLPFSVTILRDGTEVERVRVLDLSIEETLPVEIFEAP